MIILLKYSPGEDDAHLHGEVRNIFDGISVECVLDGEAATMESVDRIVNAWRSVDSRIQFLVETINE